MFTNNLQDLSPQSRRGLYTIMATWFLMNAGFFLIIPLVSVHYVGELGWAATFIGVVLAVRQFGQQSLTVFGGALADRLGAKSLILWGILIRTASFVMMGYATTPSLLLLSGFLAAVGGALFDAPSKAVVAALAPPQKLNDLYAQIGIAQNAARTIGPLIGGLLIQVDFTMVGFAAAAFFLVSFFVVWAGLPDVPVSSKKQTAVSGLKIAFQDRAFLLYTALMMGFWFMWVQLSIAFPLEMKALTGDSSSVAMLYTVNAVIAIVLQVPVIRLAQRFLEPLPALILGMVLMAAGLGSVVWVDSVWQLYTSMFFYSLGTVLVVPNAQTVAANMTNPAARGAYFGVNSLALAIGGGIGQIAGGSMVDLASEMQLPALPWVVSATVGVATAVGLVYFYRHNRESVQSSAFAASGD